jgi:hypothetical protein
LPPTKEGAGEFDPSREDEELALLMAMVEIEDAPAPPLNVR